jgi:putative nucleotidyltransferase with HDIG domain
MTVDDAFALLATARTLGYVGEPVSQLEHALQAAHLAVRARADKDLVLAALFHDIGHLCDSDAPTMGSVGVVDHERLGADYLRRVSFSARIADLVSLHVCAKRYLIATRPSYLRTLSEASLETLSYQGGPLDREACARFEADALSSDALRLRAWDEAAKVPDACVPGLETYRRLASE